MRCLFNELTIDKQRNYYRRGYMIHEIDVNHAMKFQIPAVLGVWSVKDTGVIHWFHKNID